MQSIGERLEEARKRQNVTLREASDATKVRMDFLTSFERNEFTIDLPDIYRRGFLKIYASFLKLDVKKVMLDYSALVSASASSKSQRQSHLARMDLESGEGNAHTKPAFRPASGGFRKTEEPAEKSSAESEKKIPMPTLSGTLDSGLMWKIGLMLGGGFTAILVLILLVNFWTRMPKDALDEEPEAPVSSNGTPAVSQPLATSTAASGAEEFTLVASGNVYVSVKEAESDIEIFRGSLSEGDSKTLSSNGPARITYTQAEFLKVTKNGQTYQAAEGSYRMRTDQF